MVAWWSSPSHFQLTTFIDIRSLLYFVDTQLIWFLGGFILAVECGGLAQHTSTVYTKLTISLRSGAFCIINQKVLKRR